jgi:PAS domain S-box-containing protein
MPVPANFPDFRLLFESASELCVVLTRDFHIVAVSEPYLRATMTKREDIVQRSIFEVFPGNAAGPLADSARNLRASLERVLRHRRADTMAVQKHDIPWPKPEGGGFEERYWKTVNSPVLNEDKEIEYIIHRVEDVTDLVRVRHRGAEETQLAQELRQLAERMEAEIFFRSRELEEANRRRKELETFIERAPVGLAMFDRQMHYLRASRRWIEDFGIGDADISGLSQYQVFPALSEELQEAHNRGLAGESLKGEADWQAVDGRTLSIRWEIQPWGDSGMDTGGIIIFAEDITERKRTMAALQRSQARFQSMYEHAAVGVELVGLDGRLLMVNLALCRMLGMHESELMGTTLAGITHPESRGDEASLIEEMVRGERDSFEIDKRYVHRDGSPVWVNVSSSIVRDGGGRPLYRISVIQDIGGRKRAEEALRGSEERLAAVIGTAMDAIITVDEERCVLLFNHAAEQTFRCSAAEAIGKPLDRFLPARFWEAHDAHIRAFGAIGAIGAIGQTARSMTSPATLAGLRADGQEFPIEATISEASIAGQKLYTVILRDITLRRESEELARLYAETQELDRIKTEFFANISHELRTPLTLILAPARRMLASDEVAGKHQQDLELIERNALLLLRHVNDLLDLAKADAGRITADYAPVDLAHLARRVASNFESTAQDRGIDFRIDAPGPVPAEIDNLKMERVLVNLLSNAFKFTPPGGRVRIGVGQAGGRGVIEVHDTGPGIPPAMREAIFERFRQLQVGADRSLGGTGLGLSIVKQFVELHGGAVKVEQPPEGNGSCFRVELPLAAPPGAAVRSAPEDQSLGISPQITRERPRPPTASPGVDDPVILVIEDHPDMNAFLASTLSDGHRVYCAWDGDEGLAKALQVRPDLILCDVMMPRMGGDRLLREIRKREEFDDVPFILLTAKADDELRVKLLREGAQDYLQKPFDTRVVLAKVKRLISDRRRRKNVEEVLHRLSGSLLQARDEEQRHLARELNENLAQCLAALQMYLSMAQKSPAVDGTEPSPLSKGMALLEQCFTDVHCLMQTLYPLILDNLGLQAAVQWHVEDVVRPRGVDVHLDFPWGAERLPPQVELAIFRIVQDALAISDATKVAIRGFQDAGEAGVEIAVQEGRFAGQGEIRVAAIRERVRSLGGRLEILAQGKGICATLPIVAR